MPSFRLSLSLTDNVPIRVGDACQAGILAARVGPGAHLKFPGVPTPNGISPEKFTYFHEMIVHEEVR